MYLKCPKCGNRTRKDDQTGEIYCPKCGIVLDDSPLDSRPDYTEEDQKPGYGPPMTHTHVGGPGTFIKHSDLKKLSPNQRKRIEKMLVWAKRVSRSIERNLNFAFGELKKYVDFLHLPNQIQEEAARIYRLAARYNLVRGRSMESMTAGALYAACRLYDNPRTLEEFSEASGIDKREIGRTYRFISRELNLSVAPADPVSYLPKFTTTLKLSPQTQTTAVKILEKAKKQEITSGKSPQGTAAAALYIAALINGEKRTQRQVADTAGITEVTIRNRYKELIRELDLRNKIGKGKKKKSNGG